MSSSEVEISQPRDNTLFTDSTLDVAEIQLESNNSEEDTLQEQSASKPCSDEESRENFEFTN